MSSKGVAGRRESPQRESNIESLLPIAIRLRLLSDLSDFLTRLAVQFGAEGAILWRQDRNPVSEHLGKTLSILSQHPAADQPPRTLPLKSATGEAVLSQCVIVIDDFQSDSRTYKQHPFMLGIQKLCVVPFIYEDGTPGSLNLYRTSDRGFDAEEVRQLQIVAEMMPALYQSLLDRLSFRVIDEVNRILPPPSPEDDEDSTEREQWPEKIAGRVKDLCRSLAKLLDCKEVAVFLNHPEAAADVYAEVATTWEFPRKREYRASITDGLTGWVLARGKEVSIDDLRTFAANRGKLRRRYDGIEWGDGLQIVNHLDAMKELKAAPTHPLSFMAVPIEGKRRFGAIRCAVALSHPYYFSSRELALLRIVANQLARFWSVWLDQRAWHITVRDLSVLNGVVTKQLSRGDYNTDPIYEETLRQVASVLPAASIIDVRMHRNGTNNLYFVATHGKAWDEGTEEERKKRLEKPFSLEGGSAGALVFKNGPTSSQFVDTEHDRTHYDETFATTRQLWVTPIVSVDHVIGVLDARTTGDVVFPRYAEAVLRLFGRQLGLYHDLIATLRTLKDAEANRGQMLEELDETRRNQSRVFKDLQHQFRSPIWVAHRRARTIVQQAGGDAHAGMELVSLRSLCAQAERVVYSTRLFVDLAEEKPISLTLTNITMLEFLRRVEEAAANHELMPEPEFGIRFRLLRESFRFFSHIRLDADLFDHALGNVLDNAGKYSYPRTTVRVFADLTRKSRFYIAVQNTGIPIRSDEAPRCVEREYQSEAALAVSGVGSGIGLWLADNIMRAHGGEVEVRPTNSAGVTEIRLIFGPNTVQMWSRS